MLKKHFAKMVLAATCVWAAGSAQGALQLASFNPNPISPGVPEFSWTGPGGNFVDGAGSHYNSSVSGNSGLEIDTPYNVGLVSALIPGETVDADGSTSFVDCTLVLSSSSNSSDFQDAGAYSFGGQTYQNLTSGSFTITASNGTTLLAGGISGDLLIVNGSTSPIFEATSADYTNGLILQAAQSQIPNLGSTGSPTISITAAFPAITVTPTSGGQSQVSAFGMDASGVFDITQVPEPGLLGVMALVGMIPIRRRRA